jgi:transcriptional regulator with XRE-family HTH domain
MIFASHDTPKAGNTVGQLVRRYRQLAGLTQEELGERADLSVRAVRNLEQGKVHRPRRGTLERLGGALGLGDADTASLIVAARMFEPSNTLATAVETTGWQADWWLKLDQALAMLIDRLGPERALLVPVVMMCPSCAEARSDATSAPDTRPQRPRLTMYKSG